MPCPAIVRTTEAVLAGTVSSCRYSKPTISERPVTSPNPAAAAVVAVGDDTSGVSGSGFFVGRGLVLTCAHVVSFRAGSVLVTWRGSRLPAKVMAVEPLGAGSTTSVSSLPDLALLQLEDATGIDHPVLGISLDEPPIGTQVGVHGYARDGYSGGPMLWSGQLLLEGFSGELLRSGGAEIPRGMAGGPVVDLGTGHLVGVVKATQSSTPFGGLAVPARVVRDFLERSAPPADPTEGPPQPADFVDRLREARAAAGNPPYEVMATRADVRPEELLAVDTHTWPTWGRVLAFLTGLGVTDPEKLAVWRQEWEAAQAPAGGPPLPLRAGIGTRGFTDAPAAADLLGRGVLVDVLVDLLSPDGGEEGVADVDGRPSEDAAGAQPPRWPEDHEGPRVIAVDGPWGSGKTTIMRLVQDRLQANARAWKSRDRATWPRRRRWLEWWRSRRLTAVGAHRLLSVWRRLDPGWDEKPPAKLEPTQRRPPTVARFEPWAHQSSEQLWAGLTKVITRAAVSAFCGSPGAARRFWFARNAERLDISRLRRQLWKGVASPLLRLSAIVAVVPVVVQLIRPETKVRVLGMTPLVLAWLLPALILALGLLHTACRYLFGRAAAFLPEELFEGPVLSGGLAVASPDPTLRDPLYHAQSGSLYLVQHDVALVLRYLRESGRELVVFVDDLDRCTPQTVTEVLQAINLFLSGNLAGCRFVIGLDLVAVAAQVNGAYTHVSSDALCHGDDPTPGWSFLRKLIQLPVTLPRLAEQSVETYLNALLQADLVFPARVDEFSNQVRGVAPAATPDLGPAAPVESSPDRVQETTVRRGYLERDEKIRRFLLERVLAAPDPSGRESKRLVTIWQFYVRRLLLQAPAMPMAHLVVLSQRLVIVAEVVARWPALARQLRAVRESHCGLYRLAMVADDYLAWSRVVSELKLDDHPHAKALDQMRQLLNDYDGVAVADLFERLETGQSVQPAV
ncbi:P-loop NTPase fold protein [Micromonospora sp. NPDC048835]|uniref:P-loop NTPase fold protein n=1 Tax=Micromonospora sp. NPDC048835 TaxID=3155147 RepID=UPI00340EF141